MNKWVGDRHLCRYWIGRANAGKTSILQKVCDTTKSPVIYRGTGGGRKRFCYSADFVSRLDPIKLDPSIEVSDVASSVGYYWCLSQRGQHNIEDEIIFSSHDGYVFHDSCGFESGGEEELRIVKNFVRKKSGETRLVDRLHATCSCGQCCAWQVQVLVFVF